jgi:hypothetical protein
MKNRDTSTVTTQPHGSWLPTNYGVVGGIGQVAPWHPWRTGYLSGAATVLDLGGTFSFTLSQKDLTPEQDDFLALWSDWYFVGQDMFSVLHRFRSEDADSLTAEQLELAGLTA